MTNIDWINAVAGKPWVDRAAGPNAFDCWGLVTDSFLRIDGISLETATGYTEGEPIEAIGTVFRDQLNWPEQERATNGSVFCVYLANGAMVHVGRVLSITGIGLYAIHAAGKNGIGQVTAEPLRVLQQRYGDRLKYYLRPNHA
ncbi:hypothetical protein ACO1PK_00720 [Alishewanella sp. d11]|uniref:hypothetical protein n=1 Tax=Alishewanella sp. d11 TaxID=3414030 RepID=UPI003BF7E299